jgi:NAD(P)-dependent dehydrogenase (short-subunit alcohol dehydrogenase family)
MGKRLEGKVAIITGGTSGIGAAATELFAEEGAKVVFAGRREENGAEIEKQLKGKGFDVTFVRTDMRVREDLENLAKAAVDTYGGIDVLFNNAGISVYKSFVEVSQETADNIIETNYRSMYKLCKIVVPILIEQGRGGAIVNTSSVGGISGAPTLVPYSASKGAVRLFSKALAAELGQFGIRVNSLHPGLTLTEMALQDPDIEFLSTLAPLKRAATPREIAYGALFLACEESSAMTATEVVIDSGAIGVVG